ncbi:hypothetical protein BDY19DRAFT_339414 [Irpex rosettiformis]|uniref:Uncharacterized protein n=1 Tax=Irpex rosettiformis TaxID=378272 RepID=A0ACB8TXW5_9APHY|nr:hypothetical protein BDY19DRAFT_339414 [Irpex rosettiformis]
MPRTRKSVKRARQPTLDVLEILRLQAMSNLPSQVRLKWEVKSWDVAPRFQLRMRRQVIGVRLDSLVQNRESDICNFRFRSLSTGRAPDSAQEPYVTRATRAKSEPPCFGSLGHDSERMSSLTEESVPTASCSVSSLATGSSNLSASSSLNSIGSSLFQRHRASNILALDSCISLPSDEFGAAVLDTSLPFSRPPSTLSLCHSLSDLSLQDGPTISGTPACQLIRTPRSPPEAPWQSNAKSYSKSSMSVPTSFRQPNHSSYPFTPLETGVSPPALPLNIKDDPLSGLETFLSQHIVQQATTPLLEYHSLSLASSSSTDPQPVKHLQRGRLRTSNRTEAPIFSNLMSGIPSPRVSSKISYPTPKPDGLASPLILDSTFKPLTSPQISQPSPLQQTVGLAGSLDYFNVHGFAFD